MFLLVLLQTSLHVGHLCEGLRMEGQSGQNAVATVEAAVVIEQQSDKPEGPGSVIVTNQITFCQKIYAKILLINNKLPSSRVII